MRLDYQQAFPQGTEVHAQFSDEEAAALSTAIVAINGWNRLAVGLRRPVGDHVSPFHAHSDGH